MMMQKRGVPIEWLHMIFEASYNVDNSFYNPITKDYERDKAYSGVKQGCPLSPLLFSIFIDPILSAIPGLQDHVICYIDDIAVIHPTKEGMTSAIQEIRVYLARLGLLLNPLKSNIMGYVHSYVDEFGNLVDPEITPKIDPAGNNYFDEEGMPKGHASTVPLYIPGLTLYNMCSLNLKDDALKEIGPVELPPFHMDPTAQVTHLGHPVRLDAKEGIYEQIYHTVTDDINKIHQKLMPTHLRVKYANMVMIPRIFVLVRLFAVSSGADAVFARRD